MRVLILGCGKRPKKSVVNELGEGIEYVNLDKYQLPGVDVHFDLDWLAPVNTNAKGFEMPFHVDSFDRVEAEDVLEHVKNIVAVVNDIWRVLKPRGTLWVRGPDARYPEQAWADPTHVRLFAPRSFNGWDRSTYDGRHYGYYFHQDRYYFKVTQIEERNKGLEYTLIKEQQC